MDERTKELIAVGASVGAHCEPCLDYHLGRARELGASEAEITMALEIGFMVEEGARDAMVVHAGKAADPGKARASSCCSGGKSKCRV